MEACAKRERIEETKNKPQMNQSCGMKSFSSYQSSMEDPYWHITSFVKFIALGLIIHIMIEAYHMQNANDITFK